MSKQYNVTFIGDYFSTICGVSSDTPLDDYVATEIANDLMREQYDWDVWEVSNTVEVEEV